MPTYDYICTKCGHEMEVVHSIHSDGPEACPKCGAPMRKGFAPPAVHYKGSGWARKERSSSRSGSAASRSSGSEDGDGASSASGGGSSGGGSSSGESGSGNTPAAATTGSQSSGDSSSNSGDKQSHGQSKDPD